MPYHYENLAMLLGDKYPSVFHDPHASLPAACGPGWLPLIETFCALAHAYNLQAGSSAKLYKVTEKFGALHIMVEGASPQIEAMAEFVHRHSMRVCEVCGGHGATIYRDGWQRTRCDGHHAFAFTLSSGPWFEI
ncbi:hypothetical protein [Pseudomonas eucalypticola]|uniref:Uncharacterized protein n=1 Tax=Pseudomonas eucalypticola TaxID=2599595 RepID=A0A7D5DBE3_9PSED|nr:hypothetical protein [Pseudomonas eucalypticola]QKZ06041.1 hypothetical protein HWQ56_20535 [Pseudomonas eucalypticola]